LKDAFCFRYLLEVNLRSWSATLVFASGYSPLAVIVAVLNFDLEKLAPRNPGMFYGVLAAALIAVILHIVVMNRLHGDYVVEITDVEDRSPELLNYSVPYIVSFASADLLADRNLSIAAGLFLALLCWMSIKTRVVLINPILIAFGYGLYGVVIKDGDSSISRLMICNSRPTSGQKIKVCVLGDNLLFGARPFTGRA
jgi:hypothetical protein